ncbi:ribonuclease Trv [Fusarium beomiforme]|uniref:Ribonuclease Trv n=1 Tax=Fusarium beomiforme TaxID=44412 RepID=A0A9P5AFP1_9HYPO|nr:ribonuclease Trv [Fusarium beomiforme]
MGSFVKLVKSLPWVHTTTGNLSQSCPADTPLSCHNSTVVTDTCCFVTDGRLLQTQLWDTDAGPSDSWTIHGFWPDGCNGGFIESCDPDRAYDSIQQILSDAGADALLDDMNTYWPSDEGPNDRFWDHEWAVHGTCVSTLDPQCYSNYETGQEVPDYFGKVVKVFKKLPTYQWLADAGITPSFDQKYFVNDIQTALEQNFGFPVVINCRGNRIDAVEYYFNVQGSFQDGEFVPTSSGGKQGHCPSEVLYLPKSNEGQQEL